MTENLDKKLLDKFRGYVVRKDLVRTIKGGANVPTFVLEYLLANACSTDDEEKIHKGIENVKRMLTELSPYSMLVSGGQGTADSLFVNNASGEIGAVGKWDAICFDESTDELFKDKEVVPLMKDYMESGSFSRAGKAGEKNASIILNGNINQPVETVLQTSNLFSPLSEKINTDTAFLDRIGFFLPGWEMIKFKPQNFTNHFGFSTDFFSEILHALRKFTYTDALGSQLRSRDTKPVRKTVSGLIKLMHPDGNFTKEDVRKYLEFAIEMRRRVKEQLKRIGGMEFWDTNFSYIDKNTQEETYVSVPEGRGDNLIEDAPLPPGTCYTATSDGEKVTLVKIEVVTLPGSGKLSISGTTANEVREDIRNAYNYLHANEKSILPQHKSIAQMDITVQVSNLLGVSVFSGVGSAVFAAIVSSIYQRNLKPALGIIGNISIGGAIECAVNFSDRVSLLSDNGARTILVPMDNLAELTTLPSTILGKTDVPFYGNTQMLIQKII